MVILLHSTNHMLNRVKAIGTGYYATVRAEGAPIVDSGETDAMLRGGLLALVQLLPRAVSRRPEAV